MVGVKLAAVGAHIVMLLREFYVPTVKDVSSDVVASSHKYSLRAGLVKQTASGIYTWLPLGLRVLRKIENIVRKEMDGVGFCEVLMPSMQPADLWKESQRYDSYGLEMLRMKDRNGREMVFGPTHEEVVSDVVRSSLRSYRDLPISLYQIQWKFRDELRPKHGVMRGREFLMKDAYTFDASLEKATQSYDKVFSAYIRIFKKMGLTPIAVKADSGAIGGNMSHEFHVLASEGESTVYYDAKVLELIKGDSPNNVQEIKNTYAAADGAYTPESCNIPSRDLRIERGIEIGHVFYLGDRYSLPMGLKFDSASGSSFVHMGCYGIGISRLVGALIEVFHDEVGIKWPESVAPFKIGIVDVSAENENCRKVCEHLHGILKEDSLYDDGHDTPGVKLTRMDLLGFPWQIIVGNSFIRDGVLELKNRSNMVVEKMSVDDLVARLSM